MKQKTTPLLRRRQYQDVLRTIVDELVKGNFGKLEADGRAGRLAAVEIERVIAEYGRTLTSVPDEAFALANCDAVDSDIETWVIDLSLWTKEEGQSDLTLTVELKRIGDEVVVEIDDLHVL